MGERTSHPPGAFSWSELVTSDADAAKEFYTALFGWEYDDQPIPDAPPYSLARRDGRTTAALFASDQQPPHWNCYVTVSSADEAADRARAAGGNVMAEPFDVMDAGRMAVLADPAGAVLSVWEARASIGAELVNAPGALIWNDLGVPDPAQVEDFYSAVFGWTYEDMPDSGGYRVIRNGGRINGGIMPDDDGPPAWTPYFGHQDVDRLATEVEGLGGRAIGEIFRMTQGALVAIQDPQGAVFAAWAGRYDD